MDTTRDRRARQRARLRSLRIRRTETPTAPAAPPIRPAPILRIGDRPRPDRTLEEPTGTLVPILRIEGSGLRCTCCQPGLRLLA